MPDLNSRQSIKDSNIQTIASKDINCNALVICGGRGSRMGDLTREIPKPLVEVSGRPMIGHITNNLVEQGVSDITFCTGYLAEKIENYVQGAYADQKDFHFSNSGVQAGILKRINEGRSNDFDATIVAYGDTFIDLDYQKVLEFHRENNSAISIISSPIQNPFGVIDFNETNQVTAFKEKPLQHYYIGSFVFSSRILDEVDKATIELPDGLGLIKLFQKYIEQNTLYTYVHDGLHLTFNTAQERSQVEKEIQKYITW